MSDPGERSGERSGGQILVDALRRQGVDRVYCVPGESYLPVLDALVDVPEIAVVSARHEGAAANMAEADGKLTGRPGICMVTRGPGATHAAIGVHTAFQDSTPMILFIGQVARGAKDREGFQEVDFRAMFAPLAKWAAEIDDPARIPEYIARAFRIALSGRAGPVVLSLPEDMLSDVILAPAQPEAAVAAGAGVRAADLQAAGELLAGAARPLLVVGGSGWTDAARRGLLQFARRNELPLVASFRRQDIIDNREANYCGHLGLGVDPTLAERLKTADVVVSIGSRLGENTTNGYTLLSAPVPAQTLVHVHPDPNELGRVYQPKVAIAAGVADFATAIAGRDLSEFPGGAEAKVGRAAWLREARDAYVKFSGAAPPAREPPGSGGFVNLSAVMSWCSEQLPHDTILCNGAGNYTVWVHRFYRYKHPRTELAPVSGAMGYGLPAAIAAKLRFPGRTVVALAGDGCFMMYPQELATAVQHHAPLVILVVNNGVYGTIRMHQERRYPGRRLATQLVNPDLVALAHSFGAFAERVESTDAFAAAFRRAVAAGRPALLDLRVDPAQLSPTFRLPQAVYNTVRGGMTMADLEKLPDRDSDRRGFSASIRHLRLFESVAQLHGVRRASEECHLSQPAVTQAIAKLEEQLGVQLLIRCATGSYLNEFGIIFHARTQRFFAQMEQALLELGVPNSPFPLARVASRITRSQIRSLMAIVENGTFAHAARALDVSQTSLQRAARDLERTLRTPLYVQTAAGIMATTGAAEFARKIKVAQREIDWGVDEVEAARGKVSGEIVIGALLLAGSAVLASVISDLVATFPNANTRILNGNAEDVLRYLRNGDVDVVIGLLRNPGSADLGHEVLAETPYVVVGRHDHPLMRRTNLTLDDMAAYEWVIGTPGASRRIHFDNMFAGRAKPVSRIATCSLPIIRPLLAQADRLTLLTTFELMHEEDLLAAVPYGPIEPVPSIGLTMRQNWLPTQMQTQMIDLIRRRTVQALSPLKDLERIGDGSGAKGEERPLATS